MLKGEDIEGRFSGNGTGNGFTLFAPMNFVSTPESLKVLLTAVGFL
jgi:hypothetical protein